MNRLFEWLHGCCVSKHNTLHKTEKQFGPLSRDELKYAEGAVLRLAQEEAFPSFDDSRIHTFRPFRDEAGLICVETRLTEKDDEYVFTTPVVIPHDHLVVKHLVRQYHIKGKHFGALTLWTMLRETFWIVKGRQLTHSIVRNCTVCHHYACKSFDFVSPPLPPSRVNDASVFEVCGIDYAGPFIMRGGENVWIALFTCGVYRIVHLNTGTSLSTDSFLGSHSVFYSDNATCFRGVENALEVLNWDEIQLYCSIERIQWSFNPPTASWWGRFYERMVQTVKRLFRLILGRALLTPNKLNTILHECESLVNSRPITITSATNHDPVALTLAAFLRHFRNSGTLDVSVIEARNLQSHQRYRHKLLERFRARFHSEYLGSLKRTH
ncbi:hypothetical protein PR048_009790 [Dryococelus australis]|uniref:Integrase zinc-binding domain-containing protein n=1 Tax=Dryococelus australis TaxID=614101 RepID=A0ABQ9I0W1_9NEOP|nr:hypothetical protein PR048_009790 [Dryococelus australis]